MLGPRIAVAVVVGNVIGSGIFLKPGSIAAEGGDFGLILSVWIAGGVLIVLGGLCFAELAAMLPQAGGPYVYLREAYGRPVGFLYGWNEVLFGKPASIGALAVAFAGSLNHTAQWTRSTMGEVALAVGLIALIAWVNVVGVIWGGRLQMMFTIVKAGFLALVAASPFLLMPFVDGAIELSNYWSTVEPREPTIAGQIGVVLLAVMWAYNGWHGVTPLAEEIHNPQRNVPAGLIRGTAILVALYVGANIAYHGVLSMGEMAAAGDHAAEEMLGKLLGQTGMATMSAVIMCSTFGAINTNLLQAPRITFAMGRDGAFFRSLGRVHGNYGTPAASILLMATMSILLVLGVAVAKRFVADGTVSAASSIEPSSMSPPMLTDRPESLLPKIVESLRDDSIFSLLTNFVIFAASIFYMLVALAVIVLRFRQPHAGRPFQTPGYPFVPLLFVLVYLWFILQVYWTNPLEARMGLVIIALGVPAYVAYRRFCRKAGW